MIRESVLLSRRPNPCRSRFGLAGELDMNDAVVQ